jgi:hypothetical protein
MNKQAYRLSVVINKRVAEFAKRFGCDEAIALKYLKRTNYCANYAGQNYACDHRMTQALTK